MMRFLLLAFISFAGTLIPIHVRAQEDTPIGNINGVYSVHTNMHYANKSTVIWGRFLRNYFGNLQCMAVHGM